MNKKKLVVLLSIIFVIIAGCGGAYYYYFIPNNSIEPAFDESRLNLVIDGQIIESGPGPVISDEQIMLPFNVVSKYLDPTINWDKGAQKVTVTTLSKVVRMKTDNLKAFVNNKPVNLKLPVSVKEDTVYIPIEFLSDLYNININWIKNKNIIIIDYKNKSATTAKPVSLEAVIRRGASIRYPIIEKLNSEENKQKELRVINDGAKWVKVRTWDGVIGFIERRFIETTGTTQAETTDKEQVKAPWKPVKGKITAAWDMFYEKRTGGYKDGKIEGLDVVSPTWFQVLNDKGDII
ncbi:MAG TPA: stalk domain-containing protein, partial [Clostridia bacterium]